MFNINSFGKIQSVNLSRVGENRGRATIKFTNPTDKITITGHLTKNGGTLKANFFPQNVDNGFKLSAALTKNARDDTVLTIKAPICFATILAFSCLGIMNTPEKIKITFKEDSIAISINGKKYSTLNSGLKYEVTNRSNKKTLRIFGTFMESKLELTLAFRQSKKVSENTQTGWLSGYFHNLSELLLMVNGEKQLYLKLGQKQLVTVEGALVKEHYDQETRRMNAIGTLVGNYSKTTASPETTT